MIETASWLHRIGALCVDWIASILVVMVAIGPGGWLEDPNAGFYTLGVFALENTLLTGFAGGSFGKLVTRLRVVQANGDPRPIDLLRALARSVMICGVIPPLVFRPDGRGLHDMAVGTATVTLAELRARTGP